MIEITAIIQATKPKVGGPSKPKASAAKELPADQEAASEMGANLWEPNVWQEMNSQSI